VVSTVLALLALAAPAHWTRTDLPVPKSHPEMFVVSRAVNVHGAAIYEGTFGKPGHLRQQAFLWRNGKLTRLDLRSANWVDVYGINASAAVVGDAHASAVVWRNGKPKQLGTEPSTAFAINDRGTIVGEDHDDSVIWRDGTESVLDLISAVTAINERDQVIGQLSLGAGVQHAILWQNGVSTDLGTLGAGATYATAINDDGVVVGYTATTRGTPLHAVEWKDGQAIDLGTFGAIGSEAVAINNAGDVLIETTNSIGTPTGSVLLRGGTSVVAIPGNGARAVDDDGQVLGTTSHRSFVWRGGATTLLPTSDGGAPPWGTPNTILGDWAIGDEYVPLPHGRSTSHAVLWHRQSIRTP
jgi:probable HAF family extracellular repeat protein